MRNHPRLGTVCDSGHIQDLRETKMNAPKDQRLSKQAGQFARDETGATAVEYGVMVAGISAVIIGVVIGIGSSVHDDLFLKVDALLKSLPF